MRNDQLADLILDWAEMDTCDLGECLYADLVTTASYEAGISRDRARREIDKLERQGYLKVDHGTITVTDRRRKEEMADAVMLAGLGVPKCGICGKPIVYCGHLTDELEEELILGACIEKE